jgi:methyl-accepting chemotaxis protein
VIADTPGLGGLFREHSDFTWRYVPNADAVFFVLDSVEAVMTKQEVESLQKLRQMTSLLCFVQTKIDLVSTDQWQQWRDRNLDIIAEHLQMSRASILYFPVSSALKERADRQQSATHLARSGFDQLQEFFRTTLLGGKEDALARALLQVLATEAAGIRRRQGDALRVLDVQTKEELDTLGHEFTETKTQFEQWRTTVYQRTIREFQDRSAALRRATIDRFQNQVDPSPQGPIIRPIMEQVRETELTAGQLNDRAKDIQSVCIDVCSQEIMQLQSQYHQDMKQLIATTSAQLERSCTVEVSALARGVEIPTVEHLNMHVSGFEDARTKLQNILIDSPPYTFFLINGDIELNRDR